VIGEIPEIPLGTLTCQANDTFGVVELKETGDELVPLQID
jgi:hypothetical protein